MALLEVKDLTVTYKTGGGIARAVDGVSFTLDEGEYLGLVGESGCGKTTVARAILRILPPNASYEGGQILYQDQDLVQLDERALKELRWTSIAAIPQSAMNTFNPVYRVGDQMREVIHTHVSMTKQEASDRIIEVCEKVGIDRKLVRNYPHQFSSGARQRLTIANALLLDPQLIVADEPTTGLDVIVQDQILELIGDLQRSLGKAMLLITHNMSVVAENCRRVIVMYAGKIMESGDIGEVLQTPSHPYTLGLQNAFPQLRGGSDTLIAIPGAPPNLTKPLSGCRFHERCPFATARCLEEEPPLREVTPNHFSACHFVDRIDKFRVAAKSPDTWRADVPASESA